jgi:tetratricopeptide (TPR) repeat protein
MKKRVVLFSLILVSGLSLAADNIDEQIVKGKKLLQEGVRKFDEKTLLESRSQFVKLQANDEIQWLANYYVAYADYRLAILYGSQNKPQQQIQHLDQGISSLYSTLEKNEQFADAQALLAAMLGQRISTDPQLGMSLGPESGTAIMDAKRFGKDNPRVALFSAIISYFTPTEYGGSTTRAIEEMKRAAELFETENLEDKRLPDWGESESHIWLARFYTETDQLDLAKASLDRAMKIDPQMSYAKVIESRLQEKLAKK